MTSLTSARPEVPTVRPAPRAALFAVAATQFVLMFGAAGVLSSGLGWPQSLDLPAAQALPLIHEQASTVALGYSLYFLSAFLLIPLAVMVGGALKERDGSSAFLSVTVTLGALAGVLKLLGIVRWLVAMPALAASYVSGGEASQATVAVMYDILNNYAGGVGEALGVQLFAGLWTLLVSVVLFRLPRGRVLGTAGLVASALLLAGLTELFGTDLGPVLTVSGVFWQVWLLALGLTFLRARR